MLHPAQIPLGYYVSRKSLIHQAPVGAKLLTLAVYLLLGAILADTWWETSVCAGIVLIAFFVAKIPLTIAVRQLTGPLPILLFFALVLWWRTTFSQAAMTFVFLLAAISAALLFTLTTRVSDVLEALTRWLTPFERFGLPVDTIALALSLTIRMVPLQVQAMNDVLEARKARGAGTSITAFGVPLIVRTIRRSRAIADALVARGKAD